MNLGQGLTMQKGVGETVKPQAFGVHQIRDVSSGLYPGGVARLTLIDGCIENRRFGAVHWRRCGFRLTFDSPSATRADREARPLSLVGHGRGTARFQGFGNRIVETFEPDELQLLRRALRNLIEVPPVTRAGSITLVRPAAAAATTFSLMPPTGSTKPRSEISPVIAVSLLTVRSVSMEASAVNIATPALGPSFGVAPAGTWTWMSLFSNIEGSISSCAVLLFTNVRAACALSRMTSPSWPVRINAPF